LKSDAILPMAEPIELDAKIDRLRERLDTFVARIGGTAEP